MPIGLGLGLQFAGGASGSGAPSPNPNLLLWSEEFQQAAWTTDGAVTANNAVDPLGDSTADTVVFVADGVLQQVSATAATTGSNSSAPIVLTTSWVRYSVSGTFDGSAHVFSLYLKGAVGGEEFLLIISRSGGVLACSVLESQSAAATVRAWGAKLETPTLTDYVKREGV